MDKYAIYFTWKDGIEDTFNTKDAKDREANIKNMISRNEFKSIQWCRIYKSGEYGKHHIVL